MHIHITVFVYYICLDRRRLTSHHSDLYMTSNTERTGLVTCTGCLSKLMCTGCLSKLTCCGWLVRGWRLCLVTARVDTGVKPLQPGPGTEAHTSQPAVRGGHCTVGIWMDTVDTPLHSGIYLIFEHASFIIPQA